MIEGLGTTLELLLVAATLTGIAVGWVTKVRPWRAARAEAEATKERDRIATRDALIGRPPVLDSITGKEISPALPGIGQRMATQEQQMADMASSVAQIAETQAELARVHITLEAHEGRLTALERGAVERVVTRAESAAAWRAMEAATNATPDQEPDQS